MMCDNTSGLQSIMPIAFDRKRMLWKVLQVNKMPAVIFSIVYGFLYNTQRQDRETFEKRQTTLNFYINVAKSRKNGFDGQEDLDSDDPHWIFFIPDFKESIVTNDDMGYAYEVSLQAINCITCGNYEYANTMGLPDTIMCQCPKMY